MSNWYDPNKTLSHNALFNFVIGNRSCGKSYGLKKRVIKNFLDKREQFIYLRRYKDELDKSKENYFDDIIFNNEFPNHSIEFKEGCYYLDGELFGYAMALTKAKDYKSSSYPNVSLIVFEEFILEENGYNRYLKNEVETFLGFYMSIDRYRGVKVFFLGNNYNMFNPYTLFWDLFPKENEKIVKRKNGKILLEFVDNKSEEFIKTDFGQIIEGTKFAEYSIFNKPRLNDDEKFIKRKTDKCSYYFTFKYLGELYGVWVDYNEGKFYVSKDIDPYFKVIYSLTLDDHSPNTLLLKSLRKSFYFNNFIENYKQGNVFFESRKIKAIIFDLIKMFLGGH